MCLAPKLLICDKGPTKKGENNKMAEKIGFGRVSSESAEEHDMAQIREILFGEQNRQTANRLGQVESRLGEQDAALRELLETRIDKAVKKLREELGDQGKRQALALDGLDAALRGLIEKTDERLTLLDSDLQDAGHKASQSLQALTQSLDGLRRESVDRADLAALFEGLAQQLRKTPGK